MPKILSLKKPPANVSKNQKSITQFFKTSNASNSQNVNKSQLETKASPNKETNQKPAKRKAPSPAAADTLETQNETSRSHLNSLSSNRKPHTKKYKTSAIKISPKKNDFPKSPLLQKENGIKEIERKESATKNHINNCLNSSANNEDVDLYQNNGFKEKRSPLSPIKNNSYNKTQNDDDDDDDFKSSCRINLTESSPNITKNHENIKKTLTPKKVLNFDCTDDKKVKTPQKSKVSPKKFNPTPKKSPLNGNNSLAKFVHLKTPEKVLDEECSPSKSGSTVKTIEDDLFDNDVFGDEWDMGDVDDDCKEDLDLSVMQRCEVLSVTRHETFVELKLRSGTGNTCTCIVEGIWLDTPLSPGEIISIIATRNSSGQYHVGNSSGLLTLRPDHLMSSTSVVAGVFCKRKALLQERWRGIDSANSAMTIGILIHELVQKALTQNISDENELRLETEQIIKESVQLLYDAGLEEEEAKSNMQIYISPLAQFMQMYMGHKSNMKPQKEQWSGRIDKVLDIEENMCCPQLGLKGKIDATLQVTIHERKEGDQTAIVPLELKSGKASVSAEHRGQLVLYGLMMSVLRNEDPTTSVQRGLLLYLKDRVDVREVRCGYPERRDLVMLRNQLVQYLAIGSHDINSEQLVDIEDAACTLQQRLPEPVHHPTACAKCPYLTLCSLHLWHTDGPSVSETHPLSKLREEALGHLSGTHVKYFLHWTALLKAEEKCQMAAAPIHALWTDDVQKRVKRGTCAANLKLEKVCKSGDRYLHTFRKKLKEIDSLTDTSYVGKGPQEGEFSIVSIEGRPWLAAGVVTFANDKEISIILERDLSTRQGKDTCYHIDTYESYATTVQNLTNLGVLIEDSERALRLRRLIIDRERPQFEPKLPRAVGRLGAKLMRALNIQQQRAVLRTLAARDYALLQGLPGTGKTQTISVLIQMLVGLKQRVLVTAHTHSAVDTVLSRLPDSIRVMRLGASSRVASALQSRSEQALAASCDTVKKLEELYDSMEVVGVTCLGANHAMLTRNTFDVCIVDEATQVLQCTVLRPLFAAKRFVLVGDPEQLPPVVRSRAARRLGMEESLFHRLKQDDVTSTLQLQYRMNSAIVALANTVAYSGSLKCASPEVADARLDIDVQKLSLKPEWMLKALSPAIKDAVLFLDMQSSAKSEGDRKSCTNVDEACVVLALVDALIEGGKKPQDIGVIAPYRDQVALLRRRLAPRGAEASTVDQFQGRDKPVIIYSCTKVEEADDRKVKEGEILNDQRRLAVSVTRAKHKLLVIGNSRALQKYAPLQRLIEACTHLPMGCEIVTPVLKKYRTEFLCDTDNK